MRQRQQKLKKLEQKFKLLLNIYITEAPELDMQQKLNGLL